jgi:hypothetical protein
VSAALLDIPKAALTRRTPKDCFLLRSASYEGQVAIIKTGKNTIFHTIKFFPAPAFII